MEGAKCIYLSVYIYHQIYIVNSRGSDVYDSEDDFILMGGGLQMIMRLFVVLCYCISKRRPSLAYSIRFDIPLLYQMSW